MVSREGRKDQSKATLLWLLGSGLVRIFVFFVVNVWPIRVHPVYSRKNLPSQPSCKKSCDEKILSLPFAKRISAETFSLDRAPNPASWEAAMSAATFIKTRKEIT